MPPGLSKANPKFKQIDLAWPMCKYPFGSGGKRVTTRPPCLPAARSAATISRMKLEGPESSAMIYLLSSAEPEHRIVARLRAVLPQEPTRGEVLNLVQKKSGSRGLVRPFDGSTVASR